jgi:hypothetical protein
MKILQLTDSMNLHRESIMIPLVGERDGSVTLQSDGRIRVVCPVAGSLDEWLIELQRQLETLDLSKVRH